MSNLKEWIEDRQENGDDGTGYESMPYALPYCEVCEQHNFTCEDCGLCKECDECKGESK